MPRTTKPAAEAAPTTTTAVAATPQVQAFRAVEAQLKARQDQLLAVLPPKVGVDRFMRVALGAMSRNPTLFDCTVPSVVKAMLDSAELGLEPSGLMGQAYLVPYRNKGTLEAQLIVGYRGLAELARRSGDVRQVEARIVRARDDFRVDYGTNPTIHHTPYLPGLMGSPGPGQDEAPADGAGEFLAAYAVLTFTDGTRYIEVMTAQEVAGIRARSRAKDSGPWVTDPMEMARKTVLRRALKYAPLAVVDSRVAEHLEAEDRMGQARDVTPSPAQDAVNSAAAQLRASARGDAQVEEVTTTTTEVVTETTTTTVQDGPGGEVAAEPTADTAEPEAVQGADPVASYDDLPDMAELAADAVPDGLACRVPSPYDGDTDACILESGHGAAHRGGSGATW